MFKSFILRKRKPTSRIHVELTEKARERIASITSFAESWHMENSLKNLQDEVGLSNISSFIISNIYGIKNKDTHYKLIKSANQDLAFSYIEHLITNVFNATKEEGFSYVPYYNEEFLHEICKKINNALIEEGILFELKIIDNDSNEICFEFVELSSIMQKESDEELQTIYLGTEWEKSLKPYNEAYKIFLSGANSFVIPEKLYFCFEEVVKKICKENGWDLGSKFKLSAGIEKMKEEKVFGDNKKFAMEIQDLVKMLINHTSKTAEERKRHINIDKYYCNLLLHQSSAWLVYIIKKYEEFKGK